MSRAKYAACPCAECVTYHVWSAQYKKFLDALRLFWTSCSV